jgi:hypothetical protein
MACVRASSFVCKRSFTADWTAAHDSVNFEGRSAGSASIHTTIWRCTEALGLRAITRADPVLWLQLMTAVAHKSCAPSLNMLKRTLA